MAASVAIIEGQTAPLDWLLKANGTAQNLAGMTVEAVLKTVGGKPVQTAGDVQQFNSTAGIVRLDPDEVDFRAYRSPYTLSFKVTDPAGKIAYLPSTGPVIIVVRKP